jgi:hypothetical protein
VRPAPDRPYRLLRHGLERLTASYDDPHADAKRALFRRINHERRLHGVPPLAYDARAAAVGDSFCLDQALGGYAGHWDARGRAPYVRWGLAGGVDYHAENACSYSVASGILGRPVGDLLMVGHASMMDERPPADGHRRTILDPTLTHVGIGLAAVAGEFRMTEEFTRVRLEWIQLPDRPVRAGQVAPFAAKPLAGWRVRRIEVLHEPPPRSLSIRELRERGSYGYPRPVQTLRPYLTPGAAYSGRDRGEFAVDAGGRFSVDLPLDEGPGYYVVVCFVSPTRSLGDAEPLQPATAALITAVP